MIQHRYAIYMQFTLTFIYLRFSQFFPASRFPAAAEDMTRLEVVAAGEIRFFTLTDLTDSKKLVD
jgi:hypothetical protein